MPLAQEPYSPEKLVSRVTSLISFPMASIKLNQTLAREDFEIRDIARIIEVDPALSATLLRVGNSAAMNSGIEIDTIQKAITRLGAAQVRQLVLAIEASRSFDGLPNDLWQLKDFWAHSLTCGCFARSLARVLNTGADDAAFTAGLLHDIGELILFSQAPDAARNCIELSLESDCPSSTYESEKQVFGFTHAEIGELLAAQWQLPRVLTDCIAWHHAIDDYTGTSTLPAIVHIANSLSIMHELKSRDFTDAPPISKTIWARLNMDNCDLDAVFDSAAADIDAMSTLFVH